MINYIYEKDVWQAIISIKNDNVRQMYNYMLSLRCRYKVLFVSYERLAAHFGVCVKTIGIWMSVLRNLLLVSDKKRWKKTSLYQINHLVLKFSEKYKQIFPALKHWTENALQGVYSSNVIHSLKDINNNIPVEGACVEDSSSSQDLSLNLLPQSIQMVGAEYSTKRRAYNYPKNDSKPKPTYLEWAPSSMEEEWGLKNLTEEGEAEAEYIASLADFVEPTTLNEITNLITIPELIEWLREQ